MTPIEATSIYAKGWFTEILSAEVAANKLKAGDEALGLDYCSFD